MRVASGNLDYSVSNGLNTRPGTEAGPFCNAIRACTDARIAADSSYSPASRRGFADWDAKSLSRLFSLTIALSSGQAFAQSGILLYVSSSSDTSISSNSGGTLVTALTIPGAINSSNSIGSYSVFDIGSLTVDQTVANGGILSVNGSMASNVLVNSGGTLGCSGSIGGTVTVASGGVIAPGNSPGILTVNSLTLNPGSTTRMEINGLTAGTQYDQIVANNTATLGGTLDLVFGFNPAVGNRFTLIRAGNIVPGFAAIQSTTLGAALQWRTISSATDFDVLIDQGSFMPFALTHNQQAAASMLDAQYAAWGATGLINRLDTLSAAQLPAVLASLSGE